MATLVSTGQITIVDTNDARPITAYLTANPGTQQIYSKENDTTTFVPSWYSANTNTGNQINAKVYVGGASGSIDVTNSLTNRKFCLSAGGAALANNTTSTSFVDDSGVDVSTPFTIVTDASNTYIRIKGNLKDTVASFVLFFEADYTDSNTSLVSHIITQISLNTIKTGSNATYVIFRGNDTIEQSTGETKSVAAISADLIRSSGIDTSNLIYKWYVDNAAVQVSTSYSGYATKFGTKNVTSGMPTASTTDLNVGIPASGSGNSNNTLVISETAVSNVQICRVDITDSSESKTYTGYFTIYDISDAYRVLPISSSGDKLQNGQGSTTITPIVYYGATLLTNLTGWTFKWYFYNKDGKRGAFVDTAKISTAGGGVITANTTGTSATLSSTSINANMFVAGDIIKCVKPSGEAYYYEVGSASTAGVVTIRTPSTNTWLNFTNFPAPTQTTDFVNGKIFGCTADGVRNGSSITVTGDEIDIKGNIVVEASRP